MTKLYQADCFLNNLFKSLLKLKFVFRPNQPLCFSNLVFTTIGASLVMTFYGFANVVTLPKFEEWHIDYEEAKKIAEQQNKALLVAFLGPDWCSKSDTLDDEILSNPIFLHALSKDLVFLRVDIPENFDQGDFRGAELKEKYHITECPSLIIVNPTGKEVARLSVEKTKTGEYATYVKGVLADYSQIKTLSSKKKLKKLKGDELRSLYAKAGKLADRTFKQILLEEGLKADRGSYFLLEQYGELLANEGIESRHLRRIRNKILSRDPQNASGYQRELALLDFSALKTTQTQSAKEVVKPLTDYLRQFGDKDLQHAWKLEMKIAQYFFSRDEKKEALKHAQASLKIAPESSQKEVAESIAYLKAHIQ